MEVKDLKLNAFRNFKEYAMEPGEGVNVIYGDNARGKTNIIEAIWLFTGGKSFRTSKDADFIKHGENIARTEMKFFSGKREQTASLTFGDRKTETLNGIKCTSPAEFVGNFRCVAFTPGHIETVRGAPAERRRFIDTAICQINKNYLSTLRKYTRILAQRNALLKDIAYESALLDTLDVWDERLSQCAEKICVTREKFIEKLGAESAVIYEGISGGREALRLEYKPGADLHGNIHEELLKARAADLKYGTTSVGPHRDEIEINLDGKSARSFGSQGQKKSCILAMKLAESALIKEFTGETPVILLDDVMSELDVGRREFILKKLGENQVFVTCCDKPEVYADVSGRAELKSFFLDGSYL